MSFWLRKKMAGAFNGSTSMPPESSSDTSNADNFECNICFELPQDPIVTRCGHLFCWPCIYKWLCHHSQCHECPVCKAFIQEERLIPLYGRGKTQADHPAKLQPGLNIPNRPAGQRIETPPLEAHNFPNYRFNLRGGIMPMVTSVVSNLTLSSALGCVPLFPAFNNVQVHGFSPHNVYGSPNGRPLGVHPFHGGHVHGSYGAQVPWQQQRQQQADSVSKILFLVIGFFIILCLISD